MNRTHIKWLPIFAALGFIAYQYFTSEKFVNPETGRASHVGLSAQQEAALGLQTYQQVLSRSQTISSGAELEMVQRVVRRLAAATGDAGKNFDWNVSLVQSEQVNAFCLPGGKIVVYTGILPVANNEAALATVLGHEMAHATSRHGAQRVFEQNLTQTAMIGVAGSLSDMDYEKQRNIMAALGAGAQYGVLMPFSRNHESEADHIGLLLHGTRWLRSARKHRVLATNGKHVGDATAAVVIRSSFARNPHPTIGRLDAASDDGI